MGIGTGNPEHVTLQGQRALREAAVVLIPTKGAAKEDLAEIRLQILRQAGAEAQVVPFEMPVRDENLPYQQRVARWHDEIAARWLAALRGGAEGAPGAAVEGPVALLVWGDPGLYDSTLRIAERLGDDVSVRVFPGVTALQALTAAHAIPFNTVNGAVVVTTGRRLRDHGWPEGADTVVVMLDGECSFQGLDPAGIQIWWGGFLGMPEQVLEAGPLAEVGPKIVATRAGARAQHGWIMDTYLMRR